MKTTTLIASLLVLCAVLPGCDSTRKQTQQETTQTAADTTAKAASDLITDEKMQDITQSIPSPLEISVLVKEIDPKYNATLLNKKQYTSYTTSYKQALNLGLYGTDLGYASLYEQKQEVLDYATNVKKLADQLSIGKYIDEKAINQLAQENQMNDLLNMTQQNLVQITEELLEQKREHLSLLMLTGGWIEAMHLASTVYQKTNNKMLLEHIGGQKVTLDQIMMGIEVYKDKPEMSGLYGELKKLQEIFNRVTIKTQAGKTTPSAQGDEVTVTSTAESTIVINAEDAKTITETFNAIRTSIAE